MQPRSTILIASLLALLMLPSVANAQLSEQWLVLPASTRDGTPTAERLGQSAHGALADHRLTALDPRVMPNVGAYAQDFPEDLQTRLVGAVQPALEDAAFGRSSRVLDRVNPLLEQAQQYLEALGTEHTAARAIADLALIAARVHAERRDRPAARATIERLLSLLPNPEPTIENHPGQILSELDEAKQRLRGGRGDAQLEVAAEQSGCTAYVNGQLIGPTPVSIHVYSGDYAVRVRCGDAMSRVHRTRVAEGLSRVEVNASLESALHPRPRPRLQYTDDATMAQKAHDDAFALARVAGVHNILLITVRTGTIRAEVIDASGSAPGYRRSVNLSVNPTASEVQDAWSHLLQDGGGEAIAAAPETPGDSTGGGDFPIWDVIAGSTLVLGGGALLISPIGTIIESGSCAGPAADPCSETITFGAQSGALLAIGATLIVGGIVVMIAQPIRLMLEASEDHAMLRMQGVF